MPLRGEQLDNVKADASVGTSNEDDASVYTTRKSLCTDSWINVLVLPRTDTLVAFGGSRHACHRLS